MNFDEAFELFIEYPRSVRRQILLSVTKYDIDSPFNNEFQDLFKIMKFIRTNDDVRDRFINLVKGE